MSDCFVSEDLHPHVPTYVCGKCRKPFEKGHRVLQVYISEGKGINPRNVVDNTGMYLCEEFEFVHVDCNDPFLKHGGRIG